jgi:hypothetical protein
MDKIAIKTTTIQIKRIMKYKILMWKEVENMEIYGLFPIRKTFLPGAVATAEYCQEIYRKLFCPGVVSVDGMFKDYFGIIKQQNEYVC